MTNRQNNQGFTDNPEKEADDNGNVQRSMTKRSPPGSSILLFYMSLAIAIMLTVSQKSNDGMQVPNNQNALITPGQISARKNNGNFNNERDLEAMAARIAELTDRSLKYADDTSMKNLKHQKTKDAHPFQEIYDNNNSSSSSLTVKLNAEKESQKMHEKNEELPKSKQENYLKKAEEDDSLETLPSEQIKTSDRTRKWEHSSPPRNVQDIKSRKSYDEKQRIIMPSNATEEETRLLGIWKLPPEFIGFEIEDGKSANVAKPAAIVQSRSFITNPEISSVQLNFVVPQAKMVRETNNKSSIIKNKQRRQHSNDESYSSAEHSGEGPPSDVYTETDSDLGKFLDEDYKARIEKEAEAFIKKNKQENKGETDSSEDTKQPPHSHKHHKTAYSNNHIPSPPLPQNDNVYHDNSIPSKPYSQKEYVYHNRNKPSQIHPQSGNVPSEANKPPQAYSKQKFAVPGGSIYFYKGMDGMLYDPALFPGLFESTKTRNSPKMNEDYIPPSSEVYISPDYETHPLYLEDGYPIVYSNIAHHPSSNFEQQPKLLLVHPIPESEVINEKQHRNLRPIAPPGHHQYAQPQNNENPRRPPPVYEKHLREALKVSDEQYRESPPTSYEHRERDIPEHDEYRQFQTNVNGYHSSALHQQRQPSFKEQESHQFNSDSSEEDSDCSSEEKGFDQTSGLDQDHLPVAPVPQAKLNINNPIPVTAPLEHHRSHENYNSQQFNDYPVNHNRYLPLEPITEQKNINPPMITSSHEYSPQEPISEQENLNPYPVNHNRYLPQEPITEQKNINPPMITSSHEYSPQEPISEQENLNPPINHPYSHEQNTEPVEPYGEEKENPETFQYERKHKYQVAMYEHDESIYQSNAPEISPYEPEVKTSSEEFTPTHPVSSAEEPNTIPQNQNPNFISPQDQTRHIRFESGFRPMSAPAAYGPKPDCHRSIDSDISQSDPHVNSMPSPHHRQGLEHSDAGRSPPTYHDSPHAGTNVNNMKSPNQNGKHFETEGSVEEDFHPHTYPQGERIPQQQYKDKSSEITRPTEQASRPPSSYSNSNEDKGPENSHQPKLRVVTAPIQHLKQSNHPDANQYREGHFEKDLNLNPEAPSRYRELSEPQNEVSSERKKSKRRSSKNSKGRRNKRNGKKGNKNEKKSRKHRSTREKMMTAAATYHWGMENHKDKDGFFLYANVPRDDAYEYGYRMGGPEQLVEKHHRTEGERSTIKLNWEDKNGDSGDQYWEFNHNSSEGEDEKPKKRTQKSTKPAAD
ncbi:uncharacterized protein LOC129962175 [Argiope bruennichi]|uniref:uncharacterized protein LOC129962175 n=1 Tax=Argiope bruennichi TaxID=94029 RepID=UPI002493EC6D|nr:uncharacterized protein LOC129962175 [Argiope bruennichi]